MSETDSRFAPSAQAAERFTLMSRRLVRSYIEDALKPNPLRDAMMAEFNARWNAKPWHEKAHIRIRNKLSSIGSRIHDAWMVLIGRADIGEW